MKNVLKFSAAVMIISLVAAYGLREPVLDAEDIVQNSVFKGRTFKGKTEAINADGGQIKGYLMKSLSYGRAQRAVGVMLFRV